VKITTRELAEKLGGTLVGDGDVVIEGVAGLEDARPGDLTFATRAEHAGPLRASRAAAVLVGSVLEDAELPLPRIVLADPDRAMSEAAALFLPPPFDLPEGIDPRACVAASAVLGPDVGVGPLAVIGEGVRIGARTRIGAGAYVGAETSVGEDCRVHPNATVRERVRIGNRVLLHSGCVIGDDGFGYRVSKTGAEKIPQLGTVVLEDDVEIGANATVDRARFHETRIGRGTKIDNLVMVAHHVVVGEGSILVAQSGIAGSTRLGSGVQLGAQGGIAGHLRIGDGVRLSAKSGVMTDLPAGVEMLGTPARTRRETAEFLTVHKKARRLEKEIRSLRELVERVAKDATND